MKNGVAVTNMCQHSPGAGGCRALSRATRAVLAGTWPWESLGNAAAPASARLPLKCYLGSFASFTLHSLVLFILGLLEMFSS